jgi:hypothetical protein
MFRNYERRLQEPAESLSDLTSALVDTPAMNRTITAALARQVSDIFGEAMRAGWQGVDGYREAFEILERGIKKMASRRGELTPSWLVGDVLIPAQKAALEGGRKLRALANADGNARLH